MQICDKRSEQKSFAFLPEWIAAAAFTFRVGHKGRDQLENILFAVDVAERIVVHRLLEVDGVQDFHLIAVFQHGLPTFKHDCTFRKRFVKIENGKVTNYFQFRNSPLSHHHALTASSCPLRCPCFPC